MQFSMCGQKISEEELRELLKGCALDIPEDYKEFLMEFNGGKPCPSGIKFVSDDGLNDSNGNETLIANIEAEILSTNDKQRRQTLEEDREFVRNTFIPRRVSMLFGAYSSPLGLRQHLFAASRPGTVWVEKLLPIGEEDSGGLIFLSLAHDFGSVYAIMPEYDDVAEDCAQFRIAESFTAFLNGLVPARVTFSPGFIPTERHVQIFRLDDYDE